MAESATWIGGPVDGRVISIPDGASSMTVRELVDPGLITQGPDDGPGAESLAPYVEWDVPVVRRLDGSVRLEWAGRQKVA